MEINRTQSRNSVLGINSIILEEEQTETTSKDHGHKDLQGSSKYDDGHYDRLHKFDNLMSNVKCVAIIEDVEKMFDMNDPQMVNRNLETTTSITSSNPPSFSSVFNSIQPISETKNRFAAMDSGLGNQGTDQKPRFNSLNDISDAISPSLRFIDKELLSVDGDFFKETKKETTLSCALLLDESQIRYKDDLNKKKAPPPYEKYNVPMSNRFGAMPSCYVISKEDFFRSKKLGYVDVLGDSRSSKLKKTPPGSHFSEKASSPDKSSSSFSNNPNSNVTSSNYPLEGRDNSSFVIKEKSSKSSNKMTNSGLTRGTQLIRGNSMVSVVNKGSSSMLILKIQSYIRNYLDINPDFGWRRLIDDKNLPFSNFSNNSYMFYIESKKSTHIISLANLAINIACRAFILAVTHGYLDLNLTPPFLVKYLPTHISNMLPHKSSRPLPTPHPSKSLNSPLQKVGNVVSNKNLTGNGNIPKHYYFKGGVDYLDNECGKETMYLKSNFLGIYTISSLVKNLVSENYRNRYKMNKKLPQHNLDYNSGSDTDSDVRYPNQLNNSSTPNTYYKTINNSTGFYKFVPIPEYGWKLLAKAPYDLREENKKVGLTNLFSRLFKRKPRFDTLYPSSLLCKMKPANHLDLNCKIMVDAGSLAMNIAEQLYRLEISTNNREKFPKNTFGFSSNLESKVSCPDGSVVDFVPEEVILNTASLVHEIYITQTYLIL